MSSSQGFDVQGNLAFRSMLKLIEKRFEESAETAASSQAEFEVQLREKTRQFLCSVHQADFERMDVDVPGIVLDGVRYRRRSERGRGEYMTSAGKIHPLQTSYRARGGDGGETVVPLQLRLGLVGGHWTPVAAEQGSAFMASVPSKEAAKLLASAGSMTPSSSHLDRLPKLFNDLWEADRERLEAAVREADQQQLPPVDVVTLILVSLDGIMTPMKDVPRDPETGEREEGSTGYKESGCGTVSYFDREGERLHTTRFGRMPEAKKPTLKAQIEAELTMAHRRYPNAKIQAVADGAEENWRIIKEVADALGIEVELVLDYYHAHEHACAALNRYAGKGTDVAQEAIAYWGPVLRDEPKGADRFIHALEYRAGRSSGKTREDIEKEINYFVNHKHMMSYPALQAAKQPIGSGIQEAACKTLVAERMKRSGMSWRHPGGQGILTLRGLEQSGRLHHAWEKLAPALRRAVLVDEDTERKKPARMPG